MAYFQNRFASDFKGNWILADRTYGPVFQIGPNQNTDEYQLAYASEPYNFSAGGILTLNYAWDVDFKAYSALAIDVTGVNPAATLATEVVTILNANATFAENWVAKAVNLPQVAPPDFSTPPYTVMITSNPTRKKKQIRIYISNDGAETQMHFNGKAPIAELPFYFDRHTILNRFNYPDSIGTLTKLTSLITSISVASPTVVTSYNHGLTTGATIVAYGTNSVANINGPQTVTVIDANTFTVPVIVTVAGDMGWFLTTVHNNLMLYAGINPAYMQYDWQLLKGRGSGLFMFQKMTVDASNRITQIIEYPAGAVPGDFAKKIQYTYSGTNTSPSQITEIPYVLQSVDLVTPP
jgi:hypothetical protein